MLRSASINYVLSTLSCSRNILKTILIFPIKNNQNRLFKSGQKSFFQTYRSSYRFFIQTSWFRWFSNFLIGKNEKLGLSYSSKLFWIGLKKEHRSWWHLHHFSKKILRAYSEWCKRKILSHRPAFYLKRAHFGSLFCKFFQQRCFWRFFCQKTIF